MLWAVCATLGISALVWVFSAPTTIVKVNRLLGISNVSALVVYCLIIALAASAQVLVLYWRNEKATKNARARVVIFAGLIAIMIVLFALGSVPVQRLTDFDTYYARTPWIAEFITIYVLAHASAGIGVARMCWRWARDAGRPWLRRGLRIIVIGAALGLGFDSLKLIALVARWVGGNLDSLSTAVAPTFAALGVLVIAAGFTLPAAGSRFSGLRASALRYRSYRWLYPLWDAVVHATPHIHTSFSLGWNLELRVTRRLAEIRDGWLSLRQYYDHRVAETARALGEQHGLGGDELAAVIEATHIAAAIKAKSEHPGLGAAGAQGASAATGTLRGGTDAATELAWLVQVSRAFAGSPVVAAALAGEPQTDQALDQAEAP
jgi:hypothetical protein